MRYWLTVILLVGIAVLALALLWFVFPQKDVEGRGNTIQASVVVILAVITAYYAWQTKVQADASNKMVKQQLKSSCPVVIPSIPLGDMGDPIQKYPHELHIAVTNHGPGVALDVEVAVRDPVRAFSVNLLGTDHELCALAAHREVNLMFEPMPCERINKGGWLQQSPVIEVRYKSVFGVRVTASHTLLAAQAGEDEFSFSRGGTSLDFKS